MRSSELENYETPEQRPVILHCNGFLHCHDFFTRQRQKKASKSRAVLSAETKLVYKFLLCQYLRVFYFTWSIQISIKTDRVTTSLRKLANGFPSDGFLYSENILQIAWRNVNLYRFKIMWSFFWDTRYDRKTKKAKKRLYVDEWKIIGK